MWSRGRKDTRRRNNPINLGKKMREGGKRK